jgi:CBS domain-containing protein
MLSGRCWTSIFPLSLSWTSASGCTGSSASASSLARSSRYLKELKYAGMIKRDLEDALEKRQQCRHDEVRKYVHTEHVDVGSDFSDAQVAEIFMHHRVLIVPVTDHDRVVGVITRADFFRSVAQRFLSP